MNEDQFNTATAGTYELRSISVVQVDNGYKLQGQRRFLNIQTGIASLQLDREAVAQDSSTAMTAVGTFLSTGSFVAAPTAG